MTLFDDRERAYEAKFAHDLEQRFRARVSAVRMLAAWAAGRMALIGAPAHAYEAAVVGLVVRNRDEGMPIGRIAADLAGAGLAVEPHVLRTMFDGFLARSVMEAMAPAVENAGRPAAGHVH